MRVHLAVVTWNRLALTRICLESLLARTPPGYTLTIVDNGSEDAAGNICKAWPPPMRISA